MSAVLSVVETNLRVYRSTWKGSVFSAFLSPLLYLASLGFGLGSLVDRGSGRAVLDGVPYARFVAPGLLAATAVQVGVGEATYPVLGAVVWQRGYLAMIATPVRVLDVLVGHATFIVLRMLVAVGAFAVVAALLGALPWTALAVGVPVAVLCGLAHVPAVMAYSVRQENDAGFAVVFRLVLVPMFLFSGTFFPVEQLPPAVRPLAWVTPLWHGTDAVRGLVLGRTDVLLLTGHLAYLLVWTGAGLALARHHYRRRLVD